MNAPSLTIESVLFNILSGDLITWDAFNRLSKHGLIENPVRKNTRFGASLTEKGNNMVRTKLLN